MPPRTDTSQTDRNGGSTVFGRGFLVVLVLSTLVVFLAIRWSNNPTRPRNTYAFQSDDFRSLTIVPWSLAGGKTISNALDAFSGTTSEYPTAGFRLIAVLSLIVVFVVCPTVYLFRWRERRLKNRPLRSELLRPSDLVYGFCALTTLCVIIGIIPLTIGQEYFRYSLRHAQAVQFNKDRLISSIAAIKYNMEQYRILPKSMFGGEGNFSGYFLPQELSQTQDGTLTTIAAGDSATIVARSSLYPSSSITVAFKQIDMSQPFGILRDWSYEGQFK